MQDYLCAVLTCNDSPSARKTSSQWRIRDSLLEQEPCKDFLVQSCLTGDLCHNVVSSELPIKADIVSNRNLIKKVERVAGHPAYV